MSAMPTGNDPLPNENNQRDVASLRVLGVFFTILGSTVLVATYWALDQPRAAIVNAASGIVLLGIGIATMMISKRISSSQ